MISLVKAAGLEDQVKVESAGTADYHIGNRPDSRSIRAARRRGVELPSRAQQFKASDFERFDYVLAMDESNLRNLWEIAPQEQQRKLFLLRDFDPNSPKGSSVPDPYYGGDEGFEEVLDLCFASCQGLLDHLIRSYDLT